MQRIVEAKVFKNGGSNAIRIPASVKVEPGSVVYIVLNDESDDFLVQRLKPSRLAKFFALQKSLGPIGDDDWLPERSHEPEPMRQSIKDLIDRK